MPTLNGRSPSETYQYLLQVNESLTGVLKAIEDGLGNSSDLRLSTSEVGIATMLSILNGSNKVSLKCGSGTADLCLFLPNSLPSANQVLSVSSINDNEIILAWQTVSAAPGGSTGQLQFNNSGVFNGMSGSSVHSSGSLTLAPSGTAANDGIVFDCSNITGTDKNIRIRFINTNGSAGGLFFQNGTTDIFKLQANNSVQCATIQTIGGGTTLGDHYLRRGSGQQFEIGTSANEDVFHLNARNQTSTQQLRGSLRSSTTDSRPVFQIDFSWYQNTDATRKGQREDFIYDTSKRRVSRDYSDGSRGYRAYTVHTTPPADGDLQNNEMVFFVDAGDIKIKYKDNSGIVTIKSVTTSVI